MKVNELIEILKSCNPKADIQVIRDKSICPLDKVIENKNTKKDKNPNVYLW